MEAIGAGLYLLVIEEMLAIAVGGALSVKRANPALNTAP